MIGFNLQIKKYILLQDNDEVLTNDQIPFLIISGRAGILRMVMGNPMSFLDLGGCLEFNYRE
jgi:hypothetical protein